MKDGCMVATVSVLSIYFWLPFPILFRSKDYGIFQYIHNIHYPYIILCIFSNHNLLNTF